MEEKKVENSSSCNWEKRKYNNNGMPNAISQVTFGDNEVYADLGPMFCDVKRLFPLGRLKKNVQEEYKTKRLEQRVH